MKTNKELKEHTIDKWKWIIGYAEQLQKFNESLKGIPDKVWEGLNSIQSEGGNKKCQKR